MGDQRAVRRVVRATRRAVAGAGRKALRAPIEVARAQVRLMAWGQSVALAAVGVQRATIEVVGDGAQRLWGLWIDRAERAMGSSEAR
jgi:hypothetical protein